MSYTTIQISRETREKLSKLRFYKNATYDEIINALMNLIPKKDDEGTYTDEFRASLLRGLLDINIERTYTSAEIKKRLGV